MQGMRLSQLTWAYGLIVIVLIGMSLSWADALMTDPVFLITTGTYRGWNLVWLVIPALAAIFFAAFAFRNTERKTLLWVTLIATVISIIVMINFAIGLIIERDPLIISKIPLPGFWITLLAFLGIIGMTARILFASKALTKNGGEERE